MINKNNHHRVQKTLKIIVLMIFFQTRKNYFRNLNKNNKMIKSIFLKIFILKTTTNNFSSSNINRIMIIIYLSNILINNSYINHN
jgi:hypothetical protein